MSEATEQRRRTEQWGSAVTESPFELDANQTIGQEQESLLRAGGLTDAAAKAAKAGSRSANPVSSSVNSGRSTHSTTPQRSSSHHRPSALAGGLNSDSACPLRSKVPKQH